MKKCQEIRSSNIKERIEEQKDLLTYLTWMQIGSFFSARN